MLKQKHFSQNINSKKYTVKVFKQFDVYQAAKKSVQRTAVH